MSTNNLARFLAGITAITTALILTLTVAGRTAANAASTTVVMVGQSSSGAAAQQFNPAAVTVVAGDAVRWDWFNGAHDVQAYDGSFSSGAKGGLNGPGKSYARTFATVGTFTYYCDEHAGQGDADPARIDERIAQGKMVGKVVVVAGGGTMTVNAQPVTFASVSADFVAQNTFSAPATWRASDTRGTGGGWNVTLSATDLASATFVIPVANMSVQLSQAAIVTVSGNTPPTTQAASYQPLSSATPMKLLSAATGTGMGTYDFTPSFRLTVPAGVPPGSYSASVVVTINAGP